MRNRSHSDNILNVGFILPADQEATMTEIHLDEAQLLVSSHATPDIATRLAQEPAA